MPSSLRSPPGPIRVSRGLPARSAVLSSTPAGSGRRVQQLHPADTCGRRRRQVVSRASSHIRAVGFPESNPDGSGPEPASKPDVDPVPDPAVSAAADPEVRGSVASRCRAQRSTARPSPTRSSRPCGSQPSQRAQDPSNRIVSVVAFDARNLLCPRRIGLTSAPSTDRSMLSGWIADLERARRALGRLIRRLREAAGNGDLEAARQGHDPSGPD